MWSGMLSLLLAARKVAEGQRKMCGRLILIKGESRILWELRVLTRNLLSRRAVIQLEFEVVEFALNGT